MSSADRLIDEVGVDCLQSIEDIIGHNVSGIRAGERLYFTGIEALIALSTGAAATLFSTLITKLAEPLAEGLAKSVSKQTSSILSMVRQRCIQTLGNSVAPEQESARSCSHVDEEVRLLKDAIYAQPALLSTLTDSAQARIRDTLVNELTVYFSECGFTALKGREIAAQIVKRMLDERNVAPKN